MKKNIKIPDIIKQVARDLRKNQTFSEKILWNELRFDKLWFRFLRQKPIHIYTENDWLNRFVIPDFYCDDKKLIIEVDWNIHDLKEILELDIEKEIFLNNLWIKVIRIKNEDIENNLKKVIEKIKFYL